MSLDLDTKIVGPTINNKDITYFVQLVQVKRGKRLLGFIYMYTHARTHAHAHMHIWRYGGSFWVDTLDTIVISCAINT